LVLLDGFVTPNTTSFLLSIEFVVMAVLGGLGSILGSLVGTAILVILPQFLTVFHEYEHVVLGAIIVVFLIFLPRGIVPALASLIRRSAA
jgi:branched-chain amino acid transport system permease protein